VDSPVSSAPTLDEREHLPAGLLDCRADELAHYLDGPTLFHIAGRREPPLFVSVLLHGNETTGWEAVRRVLARYGTGELPRSLVLFVGNVTAAEAGLRSLPGQPDYNRIWRGEGTPEHDVAAAVWQRMAERGLFASIDIHNNTGRNPHYGCINRLDPRYLRLATLFSRTVVYFIRPDAVQSNAFAELGPAVTVECGRPGEERGEAHAADLVDAALNLSELSSESVPSHDYDLFHTVATVTVPPDLDFGFESGDLVLRSDLDRLNFVELPAETGLGAVSASTTTADAVVAACSEAGEDVTGRYFTIDGGELRTRLPVMPSMLTHDPAIIRQDCLCYLMERMPPMDDPDQEEGT